LSAAKDCDGRGNFRRKFQRAPSPPGLRPLRRSIAAFTTEDTESAEEQMDKSLPPPWVSVSSVVHFCPMVHYPIAKAQDFQFN